MKEQLISQILPLLITCIVGIIAAVIKAVGDAVISLIEVKQKEAVARLGQAQYDNNVQTAYDIWGIVEEHFRVNKFIGSCIQLKIDMFNKLMLQKIPTLKQSDIDYLRQTVAGELNKGKAAATSADTSGTNTDTTVKDTASTSDSSTDKGTDYTVSNTEATPQATASQETTVTE